MSTQDTLDAVEKQIKAAIPGATVQAQGGGGHYTIAVTSAAFEGLNTLKKKRLVYAAITDLMTGSDAPIHAVDRLDTFTP
jgi:acid stress-induced BolA-like protein IbaG/YrbA